MPLANVETVEQLQDAINREKSSPKPDYRMREYLIKRAIDLGAVDMIPDDWEVDLSVN